MNELNGKDLKKGKFQRLKETIKKFTIFFSRRHIWSGLLAGFLWAFFAPFVLTAFSPSFQSLPEEAMWIFFFPLKSLFTLMDWIVGRDIIDPVLLWMVSVFVGMFLGVVFTYSIHRIRVWRRTSNISRTMPSE